MNCHANPARCKGRGRQGPGKDKVARRALKGRAFEREQRTRQEGSSGIRDRDVKEQLRLRKEWTTGKGIIGWSRRQEPRLESRTTLARIFRKTVELEVAK
jgi:hypothetical protein